MDIQRVPYDLRAVPISHDSTCCLQRSCSKTECNARGKQAMLMSLRDTHAMQNKHSVAYFEAIRRATHRHQRLHRLGRLPRQSDGSKPRCNGRPRMHSQRCAHESNTRSSSTLRLHAKLVVSVVPFVLSSLGYGENASDFISRLRSAFLAAFDGFIDSTAGDPWRSC